VEKKYRKKVLDQFCLLCRGLEGLLGEGNDTLNVDDGLLAEGGGEALVGGASLLAGLDLEHGLLLLQAQNHGHGLLGRGRRGAALLLELLLDLHAHLFAAPRIRVLRVGGEQRGEAERRARLRSRKTSMRERAGNSYASHDLTLNLDVF